MVKAAMQTEKRNWKGKILIPSVRLRYALLATKQVIWDTRGKA